MASSPPIPKAVLYYYPHSVWSSAVLLGLEEKGYGSDELELKVVDLVNGENYAPAYIRINPYGTVPALVVPLEKSLGAGIPNKYRALTDTKSVLEFLDKSRSVTSRTHTTSSAPAPALAPATIALSDVSNNIIALVHSSPIGFLGVAAGRTSQELLMKAQGPRGQYLVTRQAALHKYIAEESQGVNDAVKKVWETRKADNDMVSRVLGAAGKSELALSAQEKREREAFFEKSLEAWKGIKNVLTRLEKDLIGPYALGDQISLADLHIGVWLTRVFFVSGAPNPSPQATPKAGDVLQPGYPGYTQLEESVCAHTGDAAFKLGPKVRAFWELLKERESWQKVYANGLH